LKTDRYIFFKKPLYLMGKVFSFAFWVKIAAKSNQGFLLIFLIEIKYYLD
jgi:hypothetical protein